MEFFIKYFFSKCDQIRSFLQIWSYLLKKSFMKNFSFCAVFRKCHRLIFVSYTYVRIYMKHRVISSNQYRNVTNYINIAKTYICQYMDVLLYLRHLGGSFIGLTTHPFFILNFSEFKFEKMSKSILLYRL